MPGEVEGREQSRWTRPDHSDRRFGPLGRLEPRRLDLRGRRTDLAGSKEGHPQVPPGLSPGVEAAALDPDRFDSTIAAAPAHRLEQRLVAREGFQGKVEVEGSGHGSGRRSKRATSAGTGADSGLFLLQGLLELQAARRQNRTGSWTQLWRHDKEGGVKPAVSLAAMPGRRRATLDLARELERRGFAGLYCPSFGDGLGLCEALALVTERIEFGTSIVNIYTRHPYDYAKTACLVQELSGGRFRFGIGVSHAPVNAHYGAKTGKPTEDVRCFVEALRRGAQGHGDLPPIVLAAL
jgi:hypothetical protein